MSYMASRRVLRWVVPVDDEWHKIGAGEVALVGSRVEDAVEAWTIEYVPPGWPDTSVRTREVRVYGTGQEIGHNGVFLGSTMSRDGSLVWHLFERPDVPGYEEKVQR